MPKGMTISLGTDLLGSRPPGIPVTPAMSLYLSNGDPFTFSAILVHAENINEALILTSIYQLGDAIMATILKDYNKTTTTTSDETLIPAIAIADGERIDSLIAYNSTASAVNVEVTINNGATDIIKLVESVPATGSIFVVGGFDKVNLGSGYITKVKSSVTGIQFYASNVIGITT